jgi:DNA-binding MarR family transcriptional regulator
MNEESLFPAAIEIQLFSALLLKFFNQALEERLKEHGVKISSLQHGILRMLQYEMITISEISQRLGLDPSTLVRSIDSLERKGLVQRESDPNDRRRNPIKITAEGEALITTVPLITPSDLPFQALSSFGVESAYQLRNLLRELIKKVPEGKMVVDLMSGPFQQP